MSCELQVEPFQLCGTPLVSAYTALTASQRLIVTDEGENRSPVTIWMVVVGPAVVHAAVWVGVLLGVGEGFGGDVGVERGVELELVAARTVAAVVGGVVRRCFGAVDVDCDGVGAVVADDVAIGGDCDPCTRTLPDPLLQAVTASMKQSPAVAIPLLPMPA